MESREKKEKSSGKTRKTVKGSQSSDKQGKERDREDLKNSEKKPKSLLAGKISHSSEQWGTGRQKLGGGRVEARKDLKCSHKSSKHEKQ